MIEGDPKCAVLIGLVTLLYEQKDCSCGGPLHAVLDDGNFDDEHLCHSRGALADRPLELRVLCTAILDLLESYPEEDRDRATTSWVETTVVKHD